MIGKADFVDQSTIMMSITLIAPVSEWRELLRQLPSTHPSWKVTAVVQGLLEKRLESMSVEVEVERR